MLLLLLLLLLLRFKIDVPSGQYFFAEQNLSTRFFVEFAHLSCLPSLVMFFNMYIYIPYHIYMSKRLRS